MSISIISNIIRDCFLFLTLNDDQTISPDEAAEMRRWLMDRLREMDANLLHEVINDLEDEHDIHAFEQTVVQDIVQNLRRHAVSASSSQTVMDMSHDSRIFSQLARVIADLHLFFELTGEDKLNLDDAVKMMEFLAGSLAELEKPFLRALVDAFAEIAPEYGEAGEATVRDIARAYGLEEILAAGDPVRLAELEALDDAHHFEERDDPLEDFPGTDWRADVRRPYLAGP